MKTISGFRVTKWNDTTSVLLNPIFFLFLRQDIMHAILALRSLWSQRWTWTSDLPIPAFPVLGVLGYAVLRTGPRTLCMPDKHYTNWTVAPALPFLLSVWDKFWSCTPDWLGTHQPRLSLGSLWASYFSLLRFVITDKCELPYLTLLDLLIKQVS